MVYKNYLNGKVKNPYKYFANLIKIYCLNFKPY